MLDTSVVLKKQSKWALNFAQKITFKCSFGFKHFVSGNRLATKRANNLYIARIVCRHPFVSGIGFVLNVKYLYSS